MAEKLYTVPEAAELLKTDKNRVYALMRAGLIKYMRLGSYKIRESELDSFIEKFDGKDVNDPLNIKDIDINSINEESEAV